MNHAAPPLLRCATVITLVLAPIRMATADHWNPINNPDRFSGDLSYQLSDLPTAGQATSTPWPSSYDPVYEASAPASDAVYQASALWLSSYTDEGSATWDDVADAAEACPVFASSEQEPVTEGPVQVSSSLSSLSRDEQEDMGDDELYLGLCHAWVAAAILEPEPRLPVTVDGVSFTADDLKVLVTLDYTTTTARVVGSACSFDVGDDTLTIDEDGFIQEPSAYAQLGDGLTVDEDGFIVDPQVAFEVGDDTLTIDEDGFIQEPECYDGNAGTFHVLLTNMLGLQGLSFAVDRSPFDALQLAPVTGYQLSVQEDLDDAELEALLDAVGWGLLDTEAASYAYVETTVSYLDPLTDDGVTEQSYAYVLELDAAGAITGGTWAAGNLSAAPDFFLLPVAGAAAIVDLGDLAALVEHSVDGDDDGVSDADDACLDDAAVELDADGDGCADDVSELPALIASLGLHSGTASALQASALAAIASAERGSATSAVNQIEAFISKVEAQQGKKIGADDAALLIAFASNAAAGL